MNFFTKPFPRWHILVCVLISAFIADHFGYKQGLHAQKGGGIIEEENDSSMRISELQMDLHKSFEKLDEVRKSALSMTSDAFQCGMISGARAAIELNKEGVTLPPIDGLTCDLIEERSRKITPDWWAVFCGKTLGTVRPNQ